MKANQEASRAMFVGMGICVVMAPATGGASLLGLPLLLGARGVRGIMDDACDDEGEDNSEQEDSDMGGLVPYRGRELACLDDDFPLMTGLGSSFRPDARTVLAGVEPSLAARVLRDDREAETVRRAVSDLSPALYEMSRKHPHPERLCVEARSGKRWFGLGPTFVKVNVHFDE